MNARTQSSRVAGVVLAAGASRRLGTPKQLLTDASGRAMVVRAAELQLEAGCRSVLVVTGSGHEHVARDVTQALGPRGVVICENTAWQEGMASSIRQAIEWLIASGAPVDAAMFCACDMPSVEAAHLRALIATWAEGGQRVASAYRSASGALIRGIPALFPVADWAGLLQLTGDTGARRLVEHPDALSVFLRDGNLDLDTPADVERWRATSTAIPLSPRFRTVQ